MFLSSIAITLLVCATVGHAENWDNLKWQNDVYTGRHLDTMMTLSTATDGYVINPTVLYMYKPECLEKAKELVQEAKEEGPPEPFLIILKHDYETVRKHIWYEIDARDDLTERFMLSDDSCLKILFFQAGFHKTQPFIWTEDTHLTILQWMWHFFAVNIDIVNSLKEDITVSSGAKEISIVVGVGQNVQISTYFTKSLTFYGQNSTPIYAHRITMGLSMQKWVIEITSELITNFDIKNWWVNNQGTQKRSFDHNRVKHWQMAESELITFKQPLLLNRFTETGFKKIKIPKKVYKALRTFYDENQHLKIPESNWDDLEPLINTYSVQTSVVPLPEEKREETGKALKKVMEKWCDCELETTAFYGIREYYHGNVLRMHVDNVETHIISAILLIHQQLNGGDKWELEVIDYTGKRQQVTLEEGEMLMYESGTLIHGRPLPYEGSLFANCFLHYKPLDGWKWKRYYQDGEPIITDGEKMEPVDKVDTPFTLRKEFKENETEKERDEL